MQNSNCWQLSAGNDARLLVDAAPYFEDLYYELKCAQRSILILGWDFDSRISLIPGKASLAHFLNELCEAQDDLEIFILSWDYVALYAFDRQPFPNLTYATKAHKRISFKLDGVHPLGGSHHQKVVVIDDRIAYCGGLDITSRRWDTNEHQPDSKERLDPNGKPYDPFHDGMMKVGGPIALQLGLMARERWRRASQIPVPDAIQDEAESGDTSRPQKKSTLKNGRALPVSRGKMSQDDAQQGDDPQREDSQREDSQSRDTASDESTKTEQAPGTSHPWEVRGATIALSRTDPAHLDHQERREIESLFCELIEAATQYVYIENQYFASTSIASTIMKSLQQPRGPEIIVVLPAKQEGWMEDRTMGAMRNKLMSQVFEADRYQRFGAFHPRIRGVGDKLTVHTKLMVIDDRYIMVGSANLNNRSMGLDTEANLTIDSSSRPEHQPAISHFLTRLLGEHLGLTHDEVDERRSRYDSVLKTIRSRKRGGRRLGGYRTRQNDWLREMFIDLEFLDPPRPISAERQFDRALGAVKGLSLRMPGKILAVLGLFIGLLALGAAAWDIMPSRIAGDLNWLHQMTKVFPYHETSPALIVSLYIVASLLFIPLALAVLTTAAALDLYQAIFYGWGGGLLYATISYGMGQVLGRSIVERYIYANVGYLGRRLAGRGVLPIVYTHLFHWVPFAFASLAAGACNIGWRRFLLGTFIGIIPGVIFLSVIIHNALEFIAEPNGLNGTLAISLIVIVALWIRFCLGRNRRLSKDAVS